MVSLLTILLTLNLLATLALLMSRRALLLDGRRLADALAHRLWSEVGDEGLAYLEEEQARRWAYERAWELTLQLGLPDSLPPLMATEVWKRIERRRGSAPVSGPDFYD